MNRLMYFFSGIFGVLLVLIFVSMVIMWFSMPILLYQIFQKVSSIEEKLKK
jgi:hypothetical protein